MLKHEFSKTITGFSTDSLSCVKPAATCMRFNVKQPYIKNGKKSCSGPAHAV